VDDIRIAKELAAKDIHYVDCGTSGGVMGLERGYCQMIGGSRKSGRSQARWGIRLVVDSHGQGYDEPIDKLLVAVGRAPNVEHLNLEAVSVDYDRNGVTANERMQTTNPRIYAAGDVCSLFQFTHAADFMARIGARPPWLLQRRAPPVAPVDLLRVAPYNHHFAPANSLLI
jgi:NADPH-dependent glutamate synthase beta subunit-like oxidoreductase